MDGLLSRSENTAVRVSLRKFRLELHGDAPLQFSLYVPIYIGGEDTLTDDFGQSLALVASSINSSSAAERRIDLRSESPQQQAAWLLELRRLQYQIVCTAEYQSIQLRNKVARAEGKGHVVKGSHTVHAGSYEGLESQRR